MLDITLFKEYLNKKGSFPEKIQNLSKVEVEQYYVDWYKKTA